MGKITTGPKCLSVSKYVFPMGKCDRAGRVIAKQAVEIPQVLASSYMR